MGINVGIRNGFALKHQIMFALSLADGEFVDVGLFARK